MLLPKDVFERIEYAVFKIALLILFVGGLARIVRGELSWLFKRKRK